jgi:hypothetical protein
MPEGEGFIMIARLRKPTVAPRYTTNQNHKLLALAVHTPRKRRRSDHLHRGTSRQEPRAIRKIALSTSRYAQNAQLSHGSRESRSPLVLLTNKASKLLANGRILLREVDIGVKARDASGWVVCLGVVVDVPLARRGVLGGVDGDAGLRESCACGVGADESCEFGR